MGTHHRGSEDERRALDAYIKLVRASNTLSALATVDIGKHGLTLSQFSAMEALYHLGPLCLREIGRKILKSGGNMTLVIDNLERDGYVVRERSAKDRRQILVKLTPCGQEKIHAIFPHHAAYLTQLMSVLSSEEQQELARLTRKIGLAPNTPES